MKVRKLQTIPAQNVTAGDRTSFQVLLGPDEVPNFAMRKFTMLPGGSMPMHTNSVEHEQYVLNGTAEVVIDCEAYKVESNDILYIPAGKPHSYKNIGTDNFEFLCMVPNNEDIIRITE